MVARVDIVRLFIDIPERDASFIRAGTKASVVVKAYRNEPIEARVARTVGVLNVKSQNSASRSICRTPTVSSSPVCMLMAR